LFPVLINLCIFSRNTKVRHCIQLFTCYEFLNIWNLQFSHFSLTLPQKTKRNSVVKLFQVISLWDDCLHL
jgi:hypothetical protein